MPPQTLTVPLRALTVVEQPPVEVPIDQLQSAPSAPSAAQPVNVGGRGTGLDVRSSDQFGQGVASAVPFVGPDTPPTLPGVAGRVVGEGALLAVPAEKGVAAVKAAIPSAEHAAQLFQGVMKVAKDVPVESTPGLSDAVLRINQLADRGGSMPKAVRDLLKRYTDPAKATPTYEEMRDFASNISRLSADEAQRLTPVVRRELGNLRVELNKAVGYAAAQAGKLSDYEAAMSEYAKAAKLRDVYQDFLAGAKKALPYAAAGGAMGLGYEAVNKARELLGGD